MLYQVTGRINLTANKINFLQVRGGCNTAPVFCCLPFLRTYSLRQIFKGFTSAQAPVVHNLSPRVLIILIAILPMLFCATSSFAADRVLLGNVIEMPLSASSDPAIVNKIKFLREQVKVQGTISIIVGLRVAFAPEGKLDATGAAQQREDIAWMQLAVLDKVPPLKKKPESIKRYASMPFMALAVDAAEFETLINLTEISTIEADGLVAPLPLVK